MQATPAAVLETIDHDHQDLLDRIAELRAALRAGIRSEVTSTLADVHRYADSHFDREEREMLASRYPLYHVHRAAHGRLGREVRALEEEWAKGGVTPVLAESVLEALSDWFEVHILELDAQLARFLRAKRAPQPNVGWPTNVVRFPRSAPQ